MNNQLSILIPTHNRRAVLIRTLEKFAALGYQEFPWLIYDDGSSPEERLDDLCAQYGNLSLYRGEVCRGQSWGRSALLSHCTTPYACIMEDDTFFLEKPTICWKCRKRI